MKPYAELTRLGRLRRMRQLAEAALEAYGLSGAQLQILRQAGNTLYRVYNPYPKSWQISGALFEPGQYLMRIYQPGWQTHEAIELELSWLAAMRREADLPVPEPVPGLSGGLLTQATIPGTTFTRSCSLLSWVKGRHLSIRARDHHFRAQGRVMAKMHNFSSQWQILPGNTKRHYDWEGLFMNDAEVNLPAGESWKLLPQPWVEPFKIIARQSRQLMDSWGKGPDVYGLIHADIGMDANVLFWHGEPRVIDFDSSGFGYWMYDLAIALEHCRENPAFPRYRDALIDGYVEYRALPDKQLAQLDLFLAAFSVYWDLWAVGVTHLHPQQKDEYRQRMDREAELAIRHVSSC